MSSAETSLHWLDQYGNNYHQWRKGLYQGRDFFYRPQGIIEYAFDTDGLHFEGRADINALLTLEAKTGLTEEQIRKRILTAWTVLRLRHVLLMSKAVYKHEFGIADSKVARDRFLVVQPPRDEHDALEEAERAVVWTADYYAKIPTSDIYRHTQNVARAIDARQAMAKLYVLPMEQLPSGRQSIRILFLMGHQITDGLTSYAWLGHFRKLLNSKMSGMQKELETLVAPAAIHKRLPVPQEDLYPSILGNKVRRRWFWVLTIVLRHVRKPLPAAFPNPLRREKSLAEAASMPKTYSAILDYTKKPPLNTFHVGARITGASTKRLHRLCREAKASIGAGCFVLAAVVMMEIHEARYPDVPLLERRPFIGSFPINPRPFFNHAEEPNSLMLAFSDGVVLPFLPSSLDLDARIRLLVRQAHRQLAQYQKRVRTEDKDRLKYMSSRGAGRVIAMNYIAALERLEAKLPQELRTGFTPQGELAVTPNPTMATCGVSSTGRRDPAWTIGHTSLDVELGEGDDAFVADYRQLDMGVRARDGEFLIGIGGDQDGIQASVSFDGNAIDEKMAAEWKRRMEALLLEHEGMERAKL